MKKNDTIIKHKTILLFILLKPEKLTCIQYDSTQSHNHITGWSIIYSKTIFIYFFRVRLLSILRGHSVFSSRPQRPLTSDFEEFSIPNFIHYINFPILILEKESLVWRCHWLGIEPGTTSRTRSQHSTTRISRRRYVFDYYDNMQGTSLNNISVQFSSVRFGSALLCSTLLSSDLPCTAQFSSALLCSAQLSSAQLSSAQLSSAQLSSVLLCSTMLCSVLFCFVY